MEKMYWKQGFFEEPIEGGVEITREYWQMLLEGQSNGKVISEDINGYPVLKEYEPTIKDLQNKVLSSIALYDVSDTINVFYINDEPLWLNKNERLSIRELIRIKTEKGDTEVSIWSNNKEYILPLGSASIVIDSVDLYASECYNTTQRHIATVKSITDKSRLESYDYTVGYPDKVKINL